MNFLSSLSELLQNFGAFGYWIILIVSLAESLAFVGLFVPGGTFLAFAGFLSVHGILNPFYIALFAAVGALLGDGVSYYLGTLGTGWFRKDSRFLKLNHLESGNQFFQKYGGKSIFFGRFIGPIRPIIPFVAGMARMKIGPFILWNAVSAVLWGTIYTAIGYFFGAALPVIELWIKRAGIYSVGVILIVAGLWFVYWKFGYKIRGFYGILRRLIFLPISLFFAAALVFLIELVRDVILSEGVIVIDTKIQNTLVALRSAGGIDFFSLITYFGGVTVVEIVVLVVSFALWFHRKQIYMLGLWFVVAGNEITVFLLKTFVMRPRPLNSVLSVAEASPSFPSGHASVSLVLYGFLSYLMIVNARKPSQKIYTIAAALIIVLAVGFSRMYLGVHYFTDILGGYMIGALWLILGITFTEKISKNGIIKKPIIVK